MTGVDVHAHSRTTRGATALFFRRWQRGAEDSGTPVSQRSFTEAEETTPLL